MAAIATQVANVALLWFTPRDISYVCCGAVCAVKTANDAGCVGMDITGIITGAISAGYCIASIIMMQRKML